MSKIDELASQLTNDPLIDELTALLYEAAIRSSTPHEEIGMIVRGFLAVYRYFVDTGNTPFLLLL